MQRDVTGAGSLLLRGLGPSGLLVTRGLGGGVQIVIIPPGPLRQTRLGGSGRREGRFPYECIFVNARLVMINGRELPFPIEGVQQVDCRKDETLRVTAQLVSTVRRRKRIIVRARLVVPEDS